MRRSTTFSLTLTLVLVAMLGFAPGMLAKQEQEGTPIPDPAPSFEDIFVTCNGEKCEDEAIEIGRQRTYDVEFGPAAYVPELTYDEAIVVLVLEGTLAFRVQTRDVIVDPQGIGGDAADNEIRMLTTDVPVPFGGTPSSLNASPANQPIYSADDTIEADCSRDPAGPLLDLCLLNPTQFADQMTFVQLEKDDIVYLPAGSSCFICNITDVSHEDSESGSSARVQVWAPGRNFSWKELSQRDNSLRMPAEQGSGRIVGWMFNPGSRCN
jgi:hypothetical protein